MDMIYRQEYRVHTYETDARGLAKTVALFNYLQDAAGEHAGRLGVSVLDLFKRGLTWVLSRHHVLVHRYPPMGERLEVTTWPSGKEGYFATRDFEVASAAGPVLSATSSWMVLSLERKQPVKIDAAIGIPYAVERRALADPFDKLPVPAGPGDGVRFRVESAHLDWNRHVNNAVYVQWALEAVPGEVLQGRLLPVEIEVSYRAETFFGEEVVSVAQPAPGAGPDPVYLHQILNTATGAELTRLRTRWARPDGPESRA